MYTYHEIHVPHLVGMVRTRRTFQCLRLGLGLSEEQVAFMGDDLPDLPVLSRVGLSASPADAHAEVKSRVAYVTRARGGFGAVRELVDEILTAKDLLQNLIQEYLRQP